MTNKSLMEAFKFTAHDLHANREGKITEKQIDKMRRMRVGAMIIPAIFLCVATALLSVTLREYGAPHAPQDAWLHIAGALLLVVVAAIFASLRWWRISVDLSTAEVQMVDGMVDLGTARTRNVGYYGAGYRLTVRGVNLIIPEEARAAIRDADYYTIYYAPRSKVIFSIEPSQNND